MHGIHAPGPHLCIRVASYGHVLLNVQDMGRILYVICSNVPKRWPDSTRYSSSEGQGNISGKQYDDTYTRCPHYIFIHFDLRGKTWSRPEGIDDLRRGAQITRQFQMEHLLPYRQTQALSGRVTQSACGCSSVIPAGDTWRSDGRSDDRSDDTYPPLGQTS